MDSNLKTMFGFLIGGAAGYLTKSYINNLLESAKNDNKPSTILITSTTFEKAVNSGCNIQSILFDIDSHIFIWENTQRKISKPEECLGTELVDELLETALDMGRELNYYIFNTQQGVFYMVTRVRKEIAETPKESEENPNEQPETGDDNN